MATDNNKDTITSMHMKGLVIVHLNVRSLVKHKEETFISLTGSDIVCLSETWLSPIVGDPHYVQWV